MTLTDEAIAKRLVRRTRLENSDGHPVSTVAEAIKMMNLLKATVSSRNRNSIILTYL